MRGLESCASATKCLDVICSLFPHSLVTWLPNFKDVKKYNLHLQKRVVLTISEPHLQKWVVLTTGEPHLQKRVVLTTGEPHFQEQVVLTNGDH